MTLLAGAFVVLAAFLTAAVSGVLGMAGGLLLLGALLLVLPVSAAFVVHGLLQLVSNGWRAYLQRAHARWATVGWYGAGALAAVALVSAVAYVPSRPLTYLLLGFVPALVWLPRGWLPLDAARPSHAALAGLLVTALNLVAGVAGPLLDVFFVRTALGRHQVVATKAATQVLSHAGKVVVYLPLVASGTVPYAVVLLAGPLSMLGTAVGGRVLDRMTDASFTRWTRWVVTAIGAVYLVQAAVLA
ncbi:MAG: hypothetical protein JWN08_232 [Frankiales bacterium]|nr:hypothetical protein [Frankiales bacterium]